MAELDLSSIELDSIAGDGSMRRFEDVRVSFARWNTGIPLTDAELSELEYTQSEMIHEIWYSLTC